MFFCKVVQVQSYNKIHLPADLSVCHLLLDFVILLSVIKENVNFLHLHFNYHFKWKYFLEWCVNTLRFFYLQCTVNKLLLNGRCHQKSDLRWVSLVLGKKKKYQSNRLTWEPIFLLILAVSQSVTLFYLSGDDRQHGYLSVVSFLYFCVHTYL